jgi:hypothetical protein
MAKILDAKQSDVITVEGFEDIDIETDCGTKYIQIKHSDNVEIYPGKQNGITKSMKAMIARGIKPSDTLIFAQKKKDYDRTQPEFDPSTFNKKLYDAVTYNPTVAQKPYATKQLTPIDPSYNYAQHYVQEFYDFKSIPDIQTHTINTIMERKQVS